MNSKLEVTYSNRVIFTSFAHSQVVFIGHHSYSMCVFVLLFQSGSLRVDPSVSSVLIQICLMS